MGRTKQQTKVFYLATKGRFENSSNQGDTPRKGNALNECIVQSGSKRFDAVTSYDFQRPEWKRKSSSPLRLLLEGRRSPLLNLDLKGLTLTERQLKSLVEQMQSLGLQDIVVLCGASWWLPEEMGPDIYIRKVLLGDNNESSTILHF